MRIDRLAPSDKVKGRWLCHLEDGSILRIGEREVVSFALYSGMELDEETRRALEASAQEGALRQRGLSLLSARPLSRRELIDKLTAASPRGKREGAESEMAERVADWLEGLGYLDDGAYAKTVVKHYAAKGYGERKLRDELWRRGVPRELWDEALSENSSTEEGIDGFIRRKLRGEKPDERELKRLSDALARRGYRWEEIRAALRRYDVEIMEDD